MSTPKAPRHTPQVQHSFEGDVKVLNGTFESRMEMRKAATTLAQDVQRIEGWPTQIKAEIKLRVGGLQARQHVYTVTITDGAFDAEEFTRAVPFADTQPPNAAPSAVNRPSSSPGPQINGQESTPVQTTPRPNCGKTDDDDVVEIRPFKRQKLGGESSTPASTKPMDTDAMLEETQAIAKQRGSDQSEELFTFMKGWHTEWVRQGGWLFDNISKAVTSTSGSKASIEKRLDSVQDVLGQSMNSASANTSAYSIWLRNTSDTFANHIQQN